MKRVKLYVVNHLCFKINIYLIIIINGNKFFENTQYKNKYTRKSLMVDITVLQNTINYNVVLPEELKVDKFSEVFVDTVVTNNVVTNDNSTGV